MCRRVDCQTCGRPTYAGCGAHIEQVLGDVAPEKRCQCRKETSAVSSSPMQSPDGVQSRSWLQTLLGK